MTREEEFKAALLADDEFVALMTGGIYTDEETGVEGLNRGEGSPTAAAFDDKGFIKPCCVIREDAINPYGGITLLRDKIAATSQLVHLIFYQHRRHDQIFLAKARSYTVLQGYRDISDAYPIWWVYDTSPYPDMGPVKNSTMLRQDWQVVGTRKPNA